MSYRRNSDAAQSWNTWVIRHRDALLACGVPLVVFENKRHWTYFLEHGYFTPPGFTEPVVDIDRMEKSHLEMLQTLLEGTRHDLANAITSRLPCLQHP